MATRWAHKSSSALAPWLRCELLARWAKKAVPPAQPFQIQGARLVVRERRYEFPVRAWKIAFESARYPAHRNILGQEELTDHPVSRIARAFTQGAFRARLLDAYGRSCAITGEHTQPVLAAAHIQPYLGPRSNHLQNGLLLTNEFHTLFDLGYVTVTPEYVVRVSPALNEDWQNGKRYYPYDGKRLAAVPANESLRPSAAVLAWHNEQVFRRAG